MQISSPSPNRLSAILAATVVTAATACSLTSLDGFAGTSPDGGSSSLDGANDSAGSTETSTGIDAGDAEAGLYDPTCIGDRGPKMVRVTPAFCIDATEVTNDDYATFLTEHGAVPKAQTTHSTCGAKTNHTPDAWPKPSSTGKHPVVLVDWCDAWAYCTWAGKKLCGALGGGSVASKDTVDPTIDAWFLACSANGTRLYSFGTTFDPKACNGPGAGRGGPVDVASFPGCVGGLPGLFDMSGNIEEWEDSCSGNDNMNDSCVDRGGAFVHYSGQSEVERLQCQYRDTFQRKARSDNLGFRCCSR